MPSVPQNSFATSDFYFDSGDGVSTPLRQGSPPTVYRNTALSNTDVQVIGSAAELVGWNIINPNGGGVYVKFYNALAANVTVGSTTPAKVLYVPPGTVFFHDPNPCQSFATALTIACVTGLADSDATAPTTAVYVELGYR